MWISASWSKKLITPFAWHTHVVSTSMPGGGYCTGGTDIAMRTCDTQPAHWGVFTHALWWSVLRMIWPRRNFFSTLFFDEYSTWVANRQGLCHHFLLKTKGIFGNDSLMMVHSLVVIGQIVHETKLEIKRRGEKKSNSCFCPHQISNLFLLTLCFNTFASRWRWSLRKYFYNDRLYGSRLRIIEIMYNPCSILSGFARR